MVRNIECYTSRFDFAVHRYIYCASRLNGLQNPQLKLEMDKDTDETTQHGVNENILNKVKLFSTSRKASK